MERSMCGDCVATLQNGPEVAVLGSSTLDCYPACTALLRSASVLCAGWKASSAS